MGKTGVIIQAATQIFRARICDPVRCVDAHHESNVLQRRDEPLPASLCRIGIDITDRTDFW